jgi:hypothetical protein
MSLPKFDSGLDNYYRAAISPDGEFSAMSIPLDCLALPRVTLIKIGAEGHDFEGRRPCAPLPLLVSLL